jgi:hypothetical protein
MAPSSLNYAKKLNDNGEEHFHDAADDVHAEVTEAPVTVNSLSQTCRLLALPAELRNRIWEGVFIRHHEGEGRLYRQRVDLRSSFKHLSLLRTRRQIRSEASAAAELYWKTAIFVVDGPNYYEKPDNSFIDRLNDKDLKLVNSFGIITNVSYDLMDPTLDINLDYACYEFRYGVWSCEDCLTDGHCNVGCPEKAMKLWSDFVDGYALNQIKRKDEEVGQRWNGFVEVKDKTQRAVKRGWLGKARDEAEAGRIQNIQTILGWDGLTEAELCAVLDWFKREAYT